MYTTLTIEWKPSFTKISVSQEYGIEYRPERPHMEPF